MVGRVVFTLPLLSLPCQQHMYMSITLHISSLYITCRETGPSCLTLYSLIQYICQWCVFMCVYSFSCSRHAPITAFSLPQGVSCLEPSIQTPLIHSLKELYTLAMPFNLLMRLSIQYTVISIHQHTLKTAINPALN